MIRKALEAEKKASEAKRESHSAVVWALVALGVSILQIVLKELGIT